MNMTYHLSTYGIADRFLAVNCFNNMQAFLHLFEVLIYICPIVSNIPPELLPNSIVPLAHELEIEGPQF